MAVDFRAILEISSMRAELDRYLAAIDDDLTRMWGTAWGEISTEFALAAEDLIDLGDGDWPSRRQVLRSQRAANAMKAATDALDDLVKHGGTRITGDLRRVVDNAEHWQRRIVTAQLPSPDFLDWARVDKGAIGNMVQRATGQIESTLRPLTRDAQSKMKAALIRGVAVGDNPNVAASRMVRNVEGAFSGGLRRARLIARTEILDSSRASALASRKANAGVLAGWRWMCALSARSCPSCLSLHGSLHPVEEPGPQDHQAGRCTAVPVTKPWKDLGIDLPEPADTFPSAREWFGSQPESVQRHIMGPARLKALRSGDLSWDDIAVRKETPGWRPSWHIRPLNSR